MTPEPDAYRLVKLCEVVDIHVCQVTVLDKDGQPLAGIPVAFRHREGLGGGQIDETAADGTARFPLEDGAKYAVPGQGPYLAMIKSTAGNSDAVIGLGRVRGTPRHLDATFQFVPGEAPPQPTPPPRPAEGYEIIDKNGQPQDLNWLEHYFGTVEHHQDPEPEAYRLKELREVEGLDECHITILDGQGAPLPGILVSFRRRDGTGGATAETDAAGTAQFAMEEDARYPVPGQGPYLAMVKRSAGNSDAVIGLGRVRGTERHLDVTFQFAPAEPPPPEPEPPPPEPEPETEQPPAGEHWDELFAKLDQIIALLEAYVE